MCTDLSLNGDVAGLAGKNRLNRETLVLTGLNRGIVRGIKLAFNQTKYKEINCMLKELI